MVSFRKSVLLLALIAVCGILASAQIQYPPYQCTANTANPPIARSEGFAEEVGQVTITCYGGVPTKAGLKIPTVNVQIFLSTNINSRVLSDPWTEAFLLMDEPGKEGQATTQLVCGASDTGYDPLLGYCIVSARDSIGMGDYDASDTSNCVTTTTTDPVTGLPVSTTTCNKRPNIWQGRCLTASCATSSQNQLLFPGVPLNPPGTGPARVMRIVNVRANANALGASSTFIPTQINMFISISGTGAPPLANPNQLVAYVQQGLSFAVEAGRSGSPTPGPFFQCKEPPNSGYLLNTTTGVSSNVRGCINLLARFSENFPTAFRIQRFGRYTYSPDGSSTVVVYENNQNVPGLVYNTESMFYNWNLSGSSGLSGYASGDLRNAGVANNPTRLRIVFTGVPANIIMHVASREVASAIGGVPVLTSSLGWYNNSPGKWLDGSKEILAALLTSGGSTDIGSRAFTSRPDCLYWPIRETYGALNSDGTEVQWAMYPVSLSLNSSTGLYDGSSQYGIYPSGSSQGCTDQAIANGTAPTQCTGATALNNFWMGISVMYNGLPGLGVMNIAGSYAPTSTVDRWSASGGLSAAVPRFTPNTVGGTNIEIVACKTNLLFPFITNVGNFDTGIAISNTSRDPFGTRTQTGPCEMNFYGKWTSDPTMSTLKVTTPTDVAPGTSYTFALSGGVPNATDGEKTRTFQGYMIATCRFQYAHGYAFISDFGSTLFAQGYLALVMDDSAGPSRTRSYSETLGH